jgi:copper homeostasis protein
MIRQLVTRAGERIIIMPGSGVRSTNLSELMRITGAKEYHSSARTVAASAMQYISPSFTEDAGRTLVDVNEVKKMKSALLG